MAEHYLAVPEAQCPGRLHVLEVATPQELRPHDAHKAHPPEEQGYSQKPPEVGLYDAREDNQQKEGRHT